MEGWIMALNENIPIDGDGVSTCTKVDKICAAIRALRVALNAGGIDDRYLYRENVGAFTPDGDYEPATKKYVDDLILSFDSGWLLNELGGAATADWMNVHLGNDPTDPTDNLTHGLGAPLSDLIIKVLISTDETDNNSFELLDTHHKYSNGAVDSKFGITIYQVDVNNIKIQTATDGIKGIADDGSFTIIDDEDWYYKIKVWKLG